MKLRLISILIANLFLAPTLAQAADGGVEYSGAVSIGVRGVNDKAVDPSKLNEYRDLGSGSVMGGFELKGRGDSYYLNLYGENVGRDDQYLDFKGGKYGVFKYQLYSNELRHNFGSGVGARSPFSGIGGGTITHTMPFNAVPATWNTFDHSYKRRDWGGMLELQTTSPWYFRAEANEVKRDGINVFAGANSTSPGGGFMDLPAPIQYSTKNYTGEAGYSSKTAHFALNAVHSKFDNDNDVLRWSNKLYNPAVNLLDTTTLPPDNSLTRISFNGNLRQLPAASTLAGRVTYSRLTNNVDMLQTILSTGSTTPATNPSSASFNGKLATTTASLSLSSHPMKDVDSRLYWNYTNEKNGSTRMQFNPAAGVGLRGGAASGAGNVPAVNCDSGGFNPCTPEFFHYKKNNLGVEASYRINRANKLAGGWDYYDVDRERIDFHSNKDNKFFVEWKNSSLDMLTGRVKYQYLTRRSNWDVNAGAIQANTIEPFVRRFDLANLNQNQLKLVLDATPMPFLDLGLEAIYKNNDYKDTILGRTDDRREEYYASASFGDPSKFRFLVFGDVEYTRYDSFHRVGTGNPNPATAPTATTFNWSARNADRSWQLGLGADWVPMDRLKLSGSLIWARTRGTADFTVQPGGATTPFPSITNFDNTTRNSLNFKAVYDVSKQWEVTAGYAYERYRYSDIGYDNTLYVVPSTTANAQSAVTGQFSFQPYSANILYVIGKYRF